MLIECNDRHKALTVPPTVTIQKKSAANITFTALFLN
jgi:hypothetical protein